MMAAKAARPAMAMELPMVLAAPVNGVMGELLGEPGAGTEALGAPVPVGAGAPGPAGPAGTETVAGLPGGTGTLLPAGG